jgi:predicted AAA+ superfamily ATPase
MLRQMVFIAGPRQVGKTWLAKNELVNRNCQNFYYNFDDPTISERFILNPSFFESEVRGYDGRPIMVLDEIHKRSGWKNDLKHIFDGHHNYTDIIVTGSARLDVLSVSGESLAGRYLLFRMGPIGVRELESLPVTLPIEDNILEQFADGRPSIKAVQKLLEFGGFPDPLQVGTTKYRNKWAADYRRLIIREDLRDLTKISEIDKVEKLWLLLPGKVMSPLSVESLRKSLNSSHEAVSNWLFNLEKLYSIFFLPPWHEKISRAIKKEKKMYLVDWALHKDVSRKFENFVISLLKLACDTWTDMGHGEFDLRYLRNRDGKEADFLVVKDGIPLFVGDIKLADRPIDGHVIKMAEQLGKIPVIQVVKESGVLRYQNRSSLIISADRFLSSL